MQDKLREQVKIAKILNEGVFTYKDISEMLGITINGFYNWLNKQYNLNYEKEKLLRNFINDML